MTNLLLLRVHCSNILGEFVSVAGFSLTEHFYIAVLASPSLSRRLQLRLWCWLVRSQVKLVQPVMAEPLQDVSSVILGGFNPWKHICHLGSWYQTALKLGKSNKKRWKSPAAQYTVNVSSGGIAWQCYAYLHVFQRSSAFEVIATVIWLSERLSVIMTRMTSAGNPKHQTRLHKPNKNNDHYI